MSATPAGHYVYAHRRATDGAIFYVGKGKKRRAWGTQGRNPWWHHVSKKHGYTVHILASGMPEPCALTLERIAIAHVGIGNLTNLIMGGGGIPGWRHTDEAKAKIALASKGRKPSALSMQMLAERNRGRGFSAEHIEKLAAARRGRTFGPRPDAVRAKIAASHIGLRPSAEAREKMRAAKIGKCVGRDSPTYDHTVRAFFHTDGREFHGTRGDFILAFGLAAGCVSCVISGKQKSVKGWRVK